MSRFDRIELTQAPGRSPTERAGCKMADGYRAVDAVYWLGRADRERRSGNFENALRDYSRALELDCHATVGWRGQVQMLVLLDESPEAELWSRKGLEIFPNDGDLIAGRAQALCRLGQIRFAQEIGDVALSRAGESAYRWMVRGEILLAAGESAAEHCFRRAVAVDGDWLVGVEIAQICRHYGMSSRAATYVRDSLKAALDQAFPWYVLGECQSDLELRAAARRSFERCLELIPNHVAAQTSLTRLSTRPFSLTAWLSRVWGKRC